MGSSDTYLIRPNHQDKFKPAVVKECIREIVREQLTGVRYDSEEVHQLSNTLAISIKDRVKKAGFDRYKLVVQVVIGEQRGQGVKMSTRCFWDADTDSFAEDVFITENLFCVAVVFGSYFY
ncbi:unnamed protein product [Knipowitschia caucasica]|uniref:Tctex1 domain-containing protein 2 n=1 Tax=Knipowitschia caucasica TaxID=637954 RepID=A0AAV2KTX2_KNICA